MVPASEVSNYYRAALRALRFVEHRRATGRRFGTEADARWAALRGDLTTSDRIDLLVRDANAEWPSAFGARAVFQMNDVAEDDPFGAHWLPLPPVDAEELWREIVVETPPSTLGAALDAVAQAWGTKLTPFSVGTLTVGERLLVAGPNAIASTLAAFAESSDLSWHRQVCVVATAPAARQLAALAPAWLNVNQPVRIFAADESDKGLTGRRPIVSDDASIDDRRWALALQGG